MESKNITADYFMEADRRTGRSTRQIDDYIQKLFIEGSTGQIIDHYYSINNRRILNQELFERIYRRLQVEHPSLFIRGRNGFNPLLINKRDLIISLNR